MKHKIKRAAIHLPHIGMRKMKSILAVFVGFWIWQLIRLFVPALEVHPIFIYIYGLIEMRETSEKTVNFGKRRIRATFTALGVGLPLLFLSGFLTDVIAVQWAKIAVQLTVILVGALITLCIAELVGCENFCGLAAAILIILLVSHNDGEPIAYCVLRAVQTVIGVFVAWLINVKIFPYPRVKKETA